MVECNKATEVADLSVTWSEKLQARGTRRALFRLAEHRFGPLADEDRQRIEAIHSTDELERLYDRLLEARSLAELGLNGGEEGES